MRSCQPEEAVAKVPIVEEAGMHHHRERVAHTVLVHWAAGILLARNCW